MKTKTWTSFVKLSSKIVALVCVPNLALTAPETFLEGFYLDSPNSSIVPWLSASGGTFRHNIGFSAVQGGLTLYSALDETNRGDCDGGITLYASPISMVLGSSNSNNPDASSFNVWTSTAWGALSTLPLFQIDGSTGNSTYSGSNVAINNGTLSVSGTITSADSPVITAANAQQSLSAIGFINGSSSLSNALLSAAPPLSSSAWTNAFVVRGDVVEGGVLAVGQQSFAMETGALAIGDNSWALGIGATAIGSYSGAWTAGATAFGGGNANGELSLAASYGNSDGYLSFATQAGRASGSVSIALGGYDNTFGSVNSSTGDRSTTIGGRSNQAIGMNSFATGNCSATTTAYSTAMGSMNTATEGNPSEWIDTDCLFELGNGTPMPLIESPPLSARSNAITTRKNGQTTLTNKAWKANSNDPLADPASTTDNAGEALVVEGHTRLEGKVIISVPQGDISMGIYQ